MSHALFCLCRLLSAICHLPTHSAPSQQLGITHLRQETILALLRAPTSRYDVDHALVLCKTYRFQRGMLFLYEKLKLYHEILQHHMDRGENAKVIEACKQYSDAVPALWLQALTYFAEQTSVSCERDLQVCVCVRRGWGGGGG